jgi:hypothetical protein
MLAFFYHQRVAAFFKAKTRLWQYFSEIPLTNNSPSFKNDLLKSTYRLDPETEPRLYAAVAKVRETLQVKQQVTVYQLMDGGDLNAHVYTESEAVHIVFSGQALKLLDEKELLAVLAHELGHVLLFNLEDYNTSNKILNALSNQVVAGNEYLETARLFDLYTELFCDSMALRVTGDPNAAIASLVKMSTGLEQVSAESYIRQATEIFEQDKVVTENATHPEMFIRAYALHLQATQAGSWEVQIRPVIEGHAPLNQLDIFAREELAVHTRTLLDHLLAAPELQSPELLNLFNQYYPGEKINPAPLPEPELGAYDNSCRDYLAYTLLDFAMADKETEEQVLERAFVLAKTTGITDNLAAILRKELKLSSKKYNERFKKITEV